jgi:hypothetical protein
VADPDDLMFGLRDRDEVENEIISASDQTLLVIQAQLLLEIRTMLVRLAKHALNVN